MKKTKLSSAVVMAVVVLGALLPITQSQAAPAVNLLNPSDYSGTMRISTKEANGDTAYHLVAWASEIPANPLVEFEIAATPTVPGGGGNQPTVATVTATRVGADTFEGDLSTATVQDGQYFLRAILYSGLTEVARDETPVTVQSNPATAANTVEMSYPANGGPFGFWRTGSAPGVGVLTGFASSGTNQVRALYTASNPGSDPEWTQCGSGQVTEGQFRVRCTLGDTVSPTSVRAIAAVANRAPFPAPPQPSSDDTGDAHRVAPYLQNPASVSFDPASFQTEQNRCTPITMTVKDSSGIPVANLNVDVHAQGPDDQLRFATLQEGGVNRHSPFQAPDAAHTGNEPTFQCNETSPTGRQGDHNVPGAADQKHIESAPSGGTNNVGQFTFYVISGTRGGTQFTGWGDENDDDSANASSEAVGTAQLGWGTSPPPAATIMTLDPSSATANVGECERFVATATQNGAAQAGRNADVHIAGPTGVGICNPGDSTVAGPDAGGHEGDADPGAADTRHAEGTTNGSGQLIFGVTAPNTGDTSITVWLDENNSDTQDGSESSTAGSVEWLRAGGRGISLQSDRKSVRRGGKVTFSGRVSGSESCTGNQSVRLQSRKASGRRFQTIATATTDGEGAYSIRARVTKTRKYRAIAPRSGSCSQARSKTITVRTT